MSSGSGSTRTTVLNVARGAIAIAVSVGGIARSALAPPLPAPPGITLTGVVRDFEDRFSPGGHPDFEAPMSLNPDYKYDGFLVQPLLGADGLPVFNNVAGWTLLASPTTEQLCDVSFVDQFTGWAVGEGGTILKTLNGGVAWFVQNSGTSTPINAIQVDDTIQGWGVGEDGLIHPTYLGWAVGDDGLILRSDNSGATWVPVGVGITPNRLFDVQFPVDTQTGYAVGAFGTVLKSTDGGMTWSEMLPAPTASRLNACWFRSNLTGFAVGNNAVMLKTTDGAASWTSVTLPEVVVATGLPFRDVMFATSGVGYASGAGGILKSSDGGTTWEINIITPATEVRAMDFPEGETYGFAGLGNGRLLETTNGGTSWSTQTVGANYFNGVDFLTASVGYAVGDGGTIARRSPAARVVTGYAMDADGRQIAPQMFDAALGDTPATLGPPSDGGIQSQASFDQWFRDVLGVNISTALSIRLTQQADGTYVFDSATDEPYASLDGFFPIEHQLFGNPGYYSPDRNYHFTFHGHWQFLYDASAGQFFSFTGDDDVWVYVNGRLVIDLGGRHPPVEQFVDMDRLALADGEEYEMDLFYAERHWGGSNMKITTNMPLVTLGLPTISGSAD